MYHEPPIRSTAPAHRLRVGIDRLAYALGILPRSRLHMPDFLGIGAQKSGTTWVFQNLRKHPGVLLRSKELHYFDRDENWYALTLRQYGMHWRRARGRICGEITPDYCALPRGRVWIIRRVMPDVRLFMLLRNPIDRAWSSAMHRLVSKSGRTFDSLTDEELRAHFHGEGWLLGQYSRILRNWLGLFPREQLLVRYYEQIATDPEGLLADIIRHVGLEPPSDWSPYPIRERFNEGPGVAMPARHRDYLRGLYEKEIRRVAGVIGGEALGWLEAG